MITERTLLAVESLVTMVDTFRHHDLSKRTEADDEGQRPSPRHLPWTCCPRFAAHRDVPLSAIVWDIRNGLEKATERLGAALGGVLAGFSTEHKPTAQRGLVGSQVAHHSLRNAGHGADGRGTTSRG